MSQLRKPRSIEPNLRDVCDPPPDYPCTKCGQALEIPSQPYADHPEHMLGVCQNEDCEAYKEWFRVEVPANVQPPAIIYRLVPDQADVAYRG